MLGVGIEADPGETAVGDRCEQRPELAVDHVIRRVEQPGASGCVAEPPVEIGGNGHVILLRSRLTPADAA